MALMDTIQQDIKEAMRAGQDGKLTLQTLRMLKSELLLLVKSKDPSSDASSVSDEQVIDSVGKMVKQRRESIKQFEQAGRADLAEQEHKEIDILTHYLPEPLSEEAITTIIAEAIQTTGASSMKDMGKVMGIITPQVKGRADMGKISQQIKAQLA